MKACLHLSDGKTLDILADEIVEKIDDNLLDEGSETECCVWLPVPDEILVDTEVKIVRPTISFRLQTDWLALRIANKAETAHRFYSKGTAAYFHVPVPDGWLVDDRGDILIMGHDHVRVTEDSVFWPRVVGQAKIDLECAIFENMIETGLKVWFTHFGRLPI